METKKLPQTELEVMNVVWSNDKSLSTNEIAEIMTMQTGWKSGTTATLLKRLMQKGFLEVEKKGKQFYYSPIIEENDYKAIETKKFFNDIHRGSLSSLISMLHENEEISDDDLEELNNWIKNR